jgi:hypothetical protein
VHRFTRRSSVSRALAVAALATMLAIPGVAAASSRPAAASLFDAPSGIASIGGWIVVTNHGSGTLTVLSARNGARVASVGRAVVGVGAPTAIVAATVSGVRTAFVAGGGGRVAELQLRTSGAALEVTRVRILRPPGCGTKATGFLALDRDGHLVEACTDGVVTEWHTSTGALVRAIAASQSKVTKAAGIAIIGANAAVTNVASSGWSGSTADGVTLLSLSSGRRLKTVTNADNANYGFSTPGEISSDGTNLWVINTKASTVDELNGTTLAFLGSSGTNLSAPGVVLATRSFTWVSSSTWAGSSSMVTQFQAADHEVSSPWMMCNSNGPYKFDNPSGFTLSGERLWVSNESDNLVDEMDASSGTLVGTYT